MITHCRVSSAVLMAAGLTMGTMAQPAQQPPSEKATATPLRIPVSGVKPDQLVDTYSQARSEGRSHDAIDIAAPLGTPVIAATGGKVLKKFKSKRGGITLYHLDPDGRTVYYYAHMDRYAPGIVEGKRLMGGETLGYVGNSGNAGKDNYHLHFGISITEDPKKFWGGKNINPYPLLRRAP